MPAKNLPTWTFKIMLDITPISAFSDNYIWMIANPDNSSAFLVDPGDGKVALKALEAAGLTLAGILITHHHPDHVGGLDKLLARTDVPVYGPYNPAIGQINCRVKQGDSVAVLGAEFTVMEVPGHTLDHIAYYSEDTGQTPVLFSGDTLFAGGCGRVFEGDPAMMCRSLLSLRSLPEQTLIYCAHEYTLGNLDFALAVEPQNQRLNERIQADQQRRTNKIPTVPSTLAMELATNPFLRCDQNSVIHSVQDKLSKGATEQAEVFAAVRDWKDNF